MPAQQTPLHPQIAISNGSPFYTWIKRGKMAGTLTTAHFDKIIQSVKLEESL